MATDGAARTATARPTARLQRSEWPLVATVLGVAAVAWVAMTAQHELGASAAHAASATHVSHGLVGVAVTRVSGWALMVVAMMLPPAIPLLRVVQRLGADRRERRLLAGAAAAAFTAVWVAAGAAYVLADVLVAALAGDDLVDLTPVLAGGAAVLAGAYQFTSYKKACLTACRSPVVIAMTVWGRRDTPLGHVADAAVIGARFGAVCVGCCWALMALTLVVGIPAMPLMVAMALVMALERVAPRVRPFVPAVGVAAIALGLAVIAGLLPAAWPVAGTVAHYERPTEPAKAPPLDHHH